MRAAFRRRSKEDEEESVFVSMTDMTVSFLFILMIMLAFFAQQVSNEESVPKSRFDSVVAARDQLQGQLTTANQKIAALEAKIAELEVELERLKAERDPVEEYLKRTAAARQSILEQLRDYLRGRFKDLRVEISEEQDALRFQGDGLFASGQWLLEPKKREIVEALASKLEEILPCYTLGVGADWSSGCNASAAIIEAVQIEGHTDSQGEERPNLELSTQRANETFWAMLAREPTLVGFQNFRGQSVLSVAGYGEMRRIVVNDNTDQGRATNRRIDLRIIMYTPRLSTEIDDIAKRLGAVPSVGTRP